MCESGNCSDSGQNETGFPVCVYFQETAVLFHEKLMSLNGNTTSNFSLIEAVSESLRHATIRHGWFRFVIPMISILGFVGNLFNLLVLTRPRWLSNMDRLEKCATFGLAALALSDMCFCVAIFPNAFINEEYYNMVVKSQRYILFYKLYGLGLVNLFMMVSTWLIVTMAVNRYIVVVYPFYARSTLSAFRTAVTILLVYVFSATMTLPYFLLHQVTPCNAFGLGIQYEFRYRFSLELTDCIVFYIRWVWPIIADFIPFAILAFCNIRLIWELKRASNTRRKRTKGQAVKVSSQKVTLTLVIIVFVLLFMVSPSEILRFVDPYESWGRAGHIIVSVTNVLQAMNFAFNFILYCVVSANFRQTFKSMFSSCRRQAAERAEMHRMLTQADNTEKTFLEDTEIKCHLMDVGEKSCWIVNKVSNRRHSSFKQAVLPKFFALNKRLILSVSVTFGCRKRQEN